jgi:EAL and modified HD-GYP domain-containing signal transduction protein
MFDGMVGRLPIFTRSLDLFGYELRFCSGAALRQGQGDDEQRWTETVRSANEAVTFRDLVGDSWAMVRVPPAALELCEEWAWPRTQVVLALPAESVQDPAVGATAARLAKAGYTIALQNPGCDLLDLRKRADYVSICSLDAGCLEGADPKTCWLSRHDRRLQLLVRDVESRDDYERLSTLGFDYYEGRFFQRPRRLKSCDVPANRAALLELLARLQDPNIAIAEVESLVSRDMTLSYKLLRLLNSAFFGGTKPVESIRRAVLFFGLARIRNWASVILLSSADYRPKELLAMATVRARTCELLAQRLGRSSPEHYYVAGLFSLLDAIMDLPMEEILRCLKLADPIQMALMNREGPVGEVLRAALAFEQAEAAAVCGKLEEGIPASLYLEAIRWSSDLRLSLAAP